MASAEEHGSREELAEELRKLRVEDVLIQTLVTVSSIGYRRLGLTADTKDDRDLEQSRLAIETMQALTPVLETCSGGARSATSTPRSRASSSRTRRPRPRRSAASG